MPLTRKTRKMKRAMMREYGEKRGSIIFYKTENKLKSKKKRGK